MRFLLILLGLTAFSQAVMAQETVKVYELFTSQNCPYCPEADAIFAQTVIRQPGVIPLACHVTYFDREGREDPYSSDLCDIRQARYKESAVLERVFTPTAVINGKLGFHGSNQDKVNAGLATATLVQLINVQVKGERINIVLPGAKLEKPADVWLFSYDENYNVQGMTRLMSWDGAAGKNAFRVASGSAKGGYAVIAQYMDQSGVIAAGKTN